MVNENERANSIDLSVSHLDYLVLEVLNTRPAASLARIVVARRHIERGEVDEAITELEKVCPAILQDERYMFKLTKQKFIEQCCKGCDLNALECAKSQLAPLALDAFPEAYLEFKEVLSLLVYTKDTLVPKSHKSQDKIQKLCSQEARESLAASVYHSAVQILGFQEPLLILVLTYLLHLHQIHRSSVPGGHLPEQELVDQLLLLQKESPPLPCKDGTHQSMSFREADIQALIHCVGCSRREAVEALKHSIGNLELAFRHELSRFRLDRDLLETLFSEYISSRGLEVQLQDCRSTAYKALQDQDMLVDCNKSTDLSGLGGAEAGSSIAAENGQHIKGGSTSDDASWSIRQQLQNLHPNRSTSLSPPSKVARCQAIQEIQPPAGIRIQDLLMLLPQLAKEKQLDPILQMAHQLKEDFFDQHPDILFSLKRCRFLQMLQMGEANNALVYIRTDLAPLATAHEHLQPLLKATAASLLDVPRLDDFSDALQIATSRLQAALQVHIGAQGPRLVRLLHILLGVHRAWLKHQKFSDPFALSLHLDNLCTLSSGQDLTLPTAITDVDLDAYRDTAASDDDADEDVDEDKVLRLIEILELPRAMAIELLEHYEGDVEAAIMSSLG